MKTLREFQDWFERELRPKLAGMQAESNATRPGIWRVWRWWLLGQAALFIALMVLVTRNTGPDGKPPGYIALQPISWFITLFVVPIWLWARRYNWTVKVEGNQKGAALVPAIRFLVPEFLYRRQGHVSAERVRASRIFELSGKLASVGGDDHFTGKIGETAVEFSEVDVVTTFRTRHKGQRKTHRTEEQGLFLVADFNKPFQHFTLVLPDFREKMMGAELSGLIGGINDFLNTVASTVEQATGNGARDGTREAVLTPRQAGWQPVRMENLEFERQFQVYCTDPVEAHYILTPNVMERLAAFQQRMKFPLTLSFVGSAMYAYIPAGALFEGDEGADLTRFEAYQPTYEQLYVVFDLVEAMNLNARLWNKA